MTDKVKLEALQILTDDNPVLREKCEPVAEFSEHLVKLANQMVETMISFGGIGLAAPQIGQKIRMFVVLDVDKNMVIPFVNPTITPLDQKWQISPEGCLSIHGQKFVTLRRNHIKVEAFTPEGKPFSLEADGLISSIIQHENDHLDGILCMDRDDPDLYRYLDNSQPKPKNKNKKKKK